MTTEQWLASGILTVMMALMVWGKYRYDLVALLALLAGVGAGIIPANKAFTGFADELLIIVGAALVVGAAIQRSGVIEYLLKRIGDRINAPGRQVAVLTIAVAFLSAFVKNIGAMAMLMPAAFRMAKASDTSASMMLMPMAFASLLGGLITMVGTSPNIIVSRVREEQLGKPFAMFDYAPVGLGLTAVGIVFLVLAYRHLLPKDRKPAAGVESAISIDNYTTEVRVPAESALIGKSIGEFIGQNGSNVRVTSVIGATERKLPLPRTLLAESDILMLEGEADALDAVIADSGLELEGQDRKLVSETAAEEIGVIEAVVASNSVLIGSAAGRLALHDRFGLNLLAVSRSGQRLTHRLRDTRLKAGDVIVLQGELASLPERLAQLGCLPLAERSLGLGNVRKGLVPVVILAAAMLASGLGLVSVGVAFLAAALGVILSGSLSLRAAYDHVEWPILVMLGALIPVSGTLETTGVTSLAADALSTIARELPTWGAVALLMVAAMAVTPFLNNAATVLVMAPIAIGFAKSLALAPEAFLMAVAVGAGCDFLTPIGHQCNTLVMGPGGYRFGDYARLGGPLSILVLLTGVPLILAVWPV